jgi:hypothetical protein
MFCIFEGNGLASKVLHLENEEVFDHHKRLVDSSLDSNMDSHWLNKVNFFKLKVEDQVLQENKTSSIPTSKVGGASRNTTRLPFSRHGK